jgi:hypothetical protein
MYLILCGLLTFCIVGLLSDRVVMLAAEWDRIAHEDDGSSEAALQLQLQKQHPIPTITRVDVARIRIKACCIDETDVKMRNGDLSEFLAPPYIPGYACSGIIEEVGSEALNYKKGDEVVAILSLDTKHGAAAEFTVQPVINICSSFNQHINLFFPSPHARQTARGASPMLREFTFCARFDHHLRLYRAQTVRTVSSCMLTCTLLPVRVSQFRSLHPYLTKMLVRLFGAAFKDLLAYIIRCDSNRAIDYYSVRARYVLILFYHPLLACSVRSSLS